MASGTERYIPAAGHDWLLPFYDPFLRWVLREERFKRRLIEQARIGTGARVLDLGCGTGTLAIMIANLHPSVAVVGMDGDPKALAIARRKAARAGVAIQLDEGLADRLPYPERSFDRVVSSLVFHHLSPQGRDRALAEARRVLRPGGSLDVVDLGTPDSALRAWVARAFHREQRGRGRVEEEMLAGMRAAGFTAEQAGRQPVLLASLSFYRAEKP